MNFNKFYCYIVCENVGFYMEPDINILKVFLNYNAAKNFIKSNTHTHYNYFSHRRFFIVKRRLNYD